MRTSKSIRSLLQRGSQPPSITSGKVPNAVRKWESFKVEKKKKKKRKREKMSLLSRLKVVGMGKQEMG